MGTLDFTQLEEKFHLTLDEPENLILTLPASDLLRTEDMLRLIDTYGPLLKAIERSSAAAFFCSWYAGVCSAMQYMLHHGDEAILDLSLSNLSIQLYRSNDTPSFSFKMNEMRFIEIPHRDRESWCTRVLYSFYSKEVRPLIDTLSAAAQMKVGPLWGQIIYEIYNHREEELAQAADERTKADIMDHYKILTSGLDASAFGLRNNPFDVKLRFIEHPLDPDQRMLVKTACCLAYRLDADFGYCYSCPRATKVNPTFKEAFGDMPERRPAMAPDK